MQLTTTTRPRSTFADGEPRGCKSSGQKAKRAKGAAQQAFPDSPGRTRTVVCLRAIQSARLRGCWHEIPSDRGVARYSPFAFRPPDCPLAGSRRLAAKTAVSERLPLLSRTRRISARAVRRPARRSHCEGVFGRNRPIGSQQFRFDETVVNPAVVLFGILRSALAGTAETTAQPPNQQPRSSRDSLTPAPRRRRAGCLQPRRPATRRTSKRQRSSTRKSVLGLRTGRCLRADCVEAPAQHALQEPASRRAS
jgi:hypothetical protein